MATIKELMDKVYSSHIADACHDKNRYTNKSLKLELSCITDLHAISRMRTEFSIIINSLEQRLLSCPHPSTSVKPGYTDDEECQECGCWREDKYYNQEPEKVYYERCYDVMEIYTDSITPIEKEILHNFYERNLPDMSDPAKWNEYNSKMKAIFKKYPVWGDWKLRR